MNRREYLALTALAGLLPNAHAQSGGGNVSRIIVPFAAGGAREMPARAIHNELNTETGQNWIIEAKPGAGGAIGTVAVARSAPDGRTLLMAASSHFVTAALGAKPAYEPIKEFVPVANIGNQSYVLIISAEVPAKTVADFVLYAKSKPGVLNYNSAGVGSSTHLAMAYLVKAADLRMEHIPYKGTAEAVNGVAGGRGQAVIVPTAGVGPFLQDSRLQVLAVTGSKRSALFPQLPTVKESGLSGYEFDSWFGLLAPAGTPTAVVERLNQAVNKITGMPEVADRLRKLGIESSALSVAGFNKVFMDDHDQMFKLVKDIGLSRDS